MNQADKDPDLISRFVASFPKFDDMWASELDPVAWSLSSGEANELGWRAWPPSNL